MTHVLQQVTTRIETARRRVAHGLLLDRQARFWRQRLGFGRARVRDIVDETADTRTFVLQPPHGWRGHRAGQYTTIEVDLDGVRVRRCYTISSAPGDATVAITVKRKAGGRVSPWLHERLCPGDTIGLLPAAGELVLPETLPEKLLFVTGGSGVTPAMSMLRDLERRGAIGDVVVVHHARSRADVIFHDALAGLSMTSRLRLELSLDDEGGRFDERRLAALVPDFAERLTYLCAPEGLMTRVEAMWRAAGASERLRSERFVVAAPAAAPTAARDGFVSVRLRRSQRTIEVARAAPLLEELERAGLRPPTGCRIGICHTCRQHKRSGRVESCATGTLSGDGAEPIQLCITRAATDLELDL